jgi:uncharacterized protein (DUF736 family)
MGKTTKVGVAWKKQTPDGKSYLSAVITNPVGPDFRYTIWPVDEKRSEQSPDYSITKSADVPVTRPTATTTKRESGDDFPDENVPF